MTDGQMLLIATVLAVTIVAAGLLVYRIVRRVLPFVVRVERLLAGVWAAIELNWQEVAGRVQQGTAVAESWAAEQRRLRAAKRERRFPVETITGGAATQWFRVRGVDRATEQDVDVTIDAQTAENARAKAALRGIIVTEVAAIERVAPL